MKLSKFIQTVIKEIRVGCEAAGTLCPEYVLFTNIKLQSDGEIISPFVGTSDNMIEFTVNLNRLSYNETPPQ